ncbi:MAG: PQQ-dependent sugar dehydrogenase [Planctomycetota bacterium]
MKRSLLSASVLALILAGSAQGQILRSTLVQSGFTQPLYVTSPPGDTHRLFVVEHAGVIKIIKDGVLLGTPFMNIDAIVGGGQVSSDERGLLGLAFHPNFATNRKFYVDYTDTTGATVVREYLADSLNPDIADTASFTTILGPLQDPQSNHNGGCLQFGPDGMLYVGLGDGGAANDSGSGHPPIGNGQSLATYWGKILRIDVDNAPTYVAAGNPFAASAFPHIWSYGWRNPWRFSFDRTTGDMYIGDVGQGAREEVDFEPAGGPGGRNYGWKCMEGSSCSGLGGCNCTDPTLVLPIQDYTHALGCTVVGGYVYRGTKIPAFQGHYIYADYCSSTIWSFSYNGTVQNFTIRTGELDPIGALSIQTITSFGEDAEGELYLCDSSGGEIFRIEGQCPAPADYCTAAPNSAGPGGANMTSSGSGSISQNNLVLGTIHLPPERSAYYFYGPASASVPLYNGFLCVGGTIRRLPVVRTNFFGDAGMDFDATAPGSGVAPGQTWYFQLLYRDPGVGTGLNFSDGLAVPFCF